MRALLPTLLALGCPGPTDTAPPAPSVWVDETVGSIVWVSWEQPEDAVVAIVYRVDGGEWLSTPEYELEAGPQQRPLLGIPYDAMVEVELAETTLEIQTEPIPDGLPTVEILSADAESQDPALGYLLASIDEPGEVGTPEASWVFVFDRLGRIVWALPGTVQRLTLQPQVAQDGGAFLIDLNSHFGLFDRGAASQVLRVNVLGEVERTWDTPGLHHPFTDTDDGSLAWGAWGEGLETVELLDAAGLQRTLWDCTDFHEERGMPDTNCSSNTLSWDAASGRFLFSAYTTHTVVEIDDTSGETLRWFGQMPGGWAFDPKDSEFVWQHGAHYTQAGTLLVSMRLSSTAEETVVREYALDDESEMLREIWNFGESEGLYASELGEAHRLPGGNTLHNYGTAARIREVTPDGEVVWDVGFSQGSWLGRTTHIESLYDLL